MIKKLILPLICLFQFIAFGQNKISAYQYWINSDFGNQTTVTISPEENFHLQTNLDFSVLEKGFHTFNIRFQDENLMYSSVLSQVIYAKSTSDKIISYEYWFDTNYVNKVNIVVSPQEQLNLISGFDCSSLSNGTHVLHIRFLDDGDKWSSDVSQFFQKSANGSSAINKITAYRYWIDSAFTEINQTSLSTAQNPYNLIRDFDFTQVPKGEHLFNIQFKDTAGYWSSVLTDTIVKNALPIANFDYTTIANCDSTNVNLSNLSFDADTYFWDFGNGDTSGDSIPSLVYYQTGTYQISLTATDNLSGLDSTIVKTIVISGKNSSSISITECFEYLSPSGNYTWTSSGQYLDTILNLSGCDSVISIDLTINSVDASASNVANTLSANLLNANYQWIDCTNGNSEIAGANDANFTPSINGNYAVIVSNSLCSDTSNCLNVNTINTNELLEYYSINVFPNPSREFVTISFGKKINLNEIDLTIKDMTGRQIFVPILLDSNAAKIDFSTFSDGIYYLDMKINDDNLQVKLIKN